MYPTSFDIHVGYTCPQCRVETFLFLIDAKDRQEIACSCGNTFAITNILKVDFSPTYSSNAVAAISVEDKPFIASVDKSMIQDISGKLKGMGYSQSEISGGLKKAVKKNPKDRKELLRLAIANIDG
jgi:Holliday junction resolvasome RuvABC DNA-binding subunit